MPPRSNPRDDEDGPNIGEVIRNQRRMESTVARLAESVEMLVRSGFDARIAQVEKHVDTIEEGLKWFRRSVIGALIAFFVPALVLAAVFATQH